MPLVRSDKVRSSTPRCPVAPRSQPPPYPRESLVFANTVSPVFSIRFASDPTALTPRTDLRDAVYLRDFYIVGGVHLCSFVRLLILENRGLRTHDDEGFGGRWVAAPLCCIEDTIPIIRDISRRCIQHHAPLLSSPLLHNSRRYEQCLLSNSDRNSPRSKPSRKRSTPGPSKRISSRAF